MQEKVRSETLYGKRPDKVLDARPMLQSRKNNVRRMGDLEKRTMGAVLDF